MTNFKKTATEVNVGDTVKSKWFGHYMNVEKIHSDNTTVTFFGKIVAGEDFESSSYPSGITFRKTTKVTVK